MRYLVTGASGFTGSVLAGQLTAAGHQVTGYSSLYHDIADYEDVRTAISDARPDVVIHLASVASPRTAAKDPRRAVAVNVTGAANVLEAVYQAGKNARVVLAGSIDEYGYDHPADLTVDEDTPCRPGSVYGVTKLAATGLGMAYAREHGLHVVVIRPGSIAGPGQRPDSAVSAWARAMARREPVRHPGLGDLRDITDVRDMARAFAAAPWLDPGIYNACSGVRMAAADILGILTQHVLPGSIIQPDPDPGFPPRRCPDMSSAKLERACGWVPQIPLETTLKDLLDYWRSR